MRRGKSQSGQQESNLPIQLGRLTHGHYAMPAKDGEPLTSRACSAQVAVWFADQYF